MALWLRSWWRRQWRSLAVIVVILAVAGGTAMAAGAGARRSSTVVERFHAQVRPIDLFFQTREGVDPAPMRTLEGHPDVAGMAEVRFLYVLPDSGIFVPLLALERSPSAAIENWILLRGRNADPSAPYEIVVTEQMARRLDADVGDTTSWISFTPAQADLVQDTNEDVEPEGPPITFEVVGVGRAPSDIINREDDPAFTFVTPAFMKRHRGEIGTGLPGFAVALSHRDGAEDFVRAVERTYGDAPAPITEGGASGDDVVADSVAVITAALVLLASVALIAGVGAVASTVGRSQALAANELGVLRALGATNGSLRMYFVAATVPGIVLGAVVAVLAAVAVSPLFPVGLARRIEPDAGLHADGLVLLVGAAVLIIVPSVLGFALGRRRLAPEEPDRRTGPLARSVRALRPVPATGVRFALSPATRRTGPRPAVLGSVVAIAGVVAALVVATSSDRLLDTPARYGWTWDAAVNDDATGLIDRDVVDGAAIGTFGFTVIVEGRPVSGMALEPVKGSVEPTVVRGRAPRSAAEIALGRDTLAAADASLGETVEVRGEGPPLELVVVGVVALPSIEDPYPLAEGAALTADALHALRLDEPGPGDAAFRKLLLRFREGVGREEALAALGLPETETNDDDVGYPTPPPEIARLDEVRYFPALLAGLVALLGVIAVGHALFVTVWRRGHDLAVLAALGLTPPQRRGCLRWEAAALALVALAIGGPLGIVGGRIVWTSISRSMGVATDAAVPGLLLAALAPMVAVLFLAIALTPARRAGRLTLAGLLRAE